MNKHVAGGSNERTAAEHPAPRHTPGPWELGESHETKTDIHGPDHDLICTVRGRIWDEPALRKANASLIKAAPDLLAALKRLRACIMETRGPDATKALWEADAAIKKAEETE